MKLVRDTLYIDGEVYKGTLMDLRVDSQVYSQKNAGDRLPKKKNRPRQTSTPDRDRYIGTRGRAAKTEISDTQCL